MKQYKTPKPTNVTITVAMQRSSASLLASRPRPDQESRGRLAAIEGTPPSLIGLPDECAFLPRCHKATSECRSEPAPKLRQAGPAGHVAACYNPMYREDEGTAARRSA